MYSILCVCVCSVRLHSPAPGGSVWSWERGSVAAEFSWRSGWCRNKHSGKRSEACLRSEAWCKSAVVTDRPSCVSGLQSSPSGSSERTHGRGRTAAQPLCISAAPDRQTGTHLSASGRRTRTRGHGESPAGTGSGNQSHRHGEKKTSIENSLISQLYLIDRVSSEWMDAYLP